MIQYDDEIAKWFRWLVPNLITLIGFYLAAKDRKEKAPNHSKPRKQKK